MPAAILSEFSIVQCLYLCRGVVCHVYACIKNSVETQSINLGPDALDSLIHHFTEPASMLGNLPCCLWHVF